jgi:hopanoid biosynthesis associated RND transporter like protein HpnN
VTTAIGFFAFVPTDFVGVAELGLISGVGMFISLICTLTLLPALMSVPPIPAGRWKAGPPLQRTQMLSAIPLRFPRSIRASAVALGAAAIFVLPQARFDNNPLNVRDPSSESVRTFNDLLEKGGASPWSLNAVVPNIRAAESIAEELRALDSVERVVTVANYIPVDQDEKLSIIEDVAMFLAAPPGTGEGASAASIEAQIEALAKLESEIEKLSRERPSEGISGVALEFHRELQRFTETLAASDDPGPALRALETSLIASLPEQLRILTAALGAGHVTLEKLPDALLERMVTADGRARIQIFPRGGLEDQAEMAAFVADVRGVTPEVAGSAAEIVESGRAVVSALRQALLSAVVAIALVLLLLWRRVNDTALVLVPLGLAATLTVAAAVVFDIPFNFADVIVLPLLLGIGVDSGIHLVHRARVSGPGETNLLATSTARAVAYSALTTVASFGTMGFAAHMGLATLGRLLTLGVGFTLLCNLVVLPALIVLHAPGQTRAERRRPAA